MTPITTAMKTCYVTAPAGANLTVLEEALSSRNVRILVPSDLVAGSAWASEVTKQIQQADLVIGVITSDLGSASVLFELGIATAYKRRLVVFASPKADSLALPLQGLLVVRAEVENAGAISFALDQVLSAPKKSRREEITRKKRLVGLGSKADAFIERLNFDRDRKSERELESIVGDALRVSGVDVVVESSINDFRADLAIWSDVLEAYVGNPLLVEIKRTLRGSTGLADATRQLARYLDASGSQWGFLLYDEGPEVDDQTVAMLAPNVLTSSIRSLLERLRLESFPEVVRDLRNRRVHGVQ